MSLTPEDRARHAAQLLTDPLFCEIVDRMKTRAVKEWAACANPLDRDYFHARYNAVNNIVRDMLREVETASSVEVRAGKKGMFFNLYQRLKENF